MGTRTFVKALFFSIAVGQTGCTSLSTTIPLHSGEGPQVTGEGWKFRAGFGGASSRDAGITEDASLRPPDLTRPSLKQSSVVVGQVGVGVFDRADVFLKAGLNNVWVYGAKFQPVGPTKSQPKGDSFVVSLVGWGFRSASNRSGDQNGVFGPGGYRWDASAIGQGEGAELLLGFHPKPGVMTYCGGLISRFRLEGNIHHALSDNGTSPAANYPVTGSGLSHGAKVGLEFSFDSGAALRLEGFILNTKFSDSLTDAPIGASAAIDI